MAPERVSHYLVEELLGAGGMGEVYRARDLALGRPTALKMLRSSFDPGLRRRMLHEARVGSRLQHPGIATFYEAGESDGIAFIAMELVEGRTVREMLRDGPLPVDRGISIVAGVLESLGHAHASGILHRDIKPENIMVRGDRETKLLDFGLGKAILPEAAGRPAEMDGDTAALTMTTALTDAGTVVGTLGYMSPEQVCGEELDGRSDLFAVATVLYEMLAGTPAFSGAGPAGILAAIVSRDPPPITARDVPVSLKAVLARGLARNPADRYPSARSFLNDLRLVSEGGAVAILPESLAITDLENLSGDPNDNWIGTGIAETLAGELSHTSGLRILNRRHVAGALAASDPSGRPDLPEVGLRLGCRWILGGSYQKAGPMIRVLTRLVEVSTGEVVWSEKHDGTIDQIFMIQDRIAASTAERLNVARPAAAEPAVVPRSLGAYECYARGFRLWERLEKGSFEQARELYERAIAIDDTYAPAFAGLAGLHALQYTFLTDPRELELAADYARRAILLDPENGNAHVWLSYALWRNHRDAEAIEEADRAARFPASAHYGHYFAACALLSQNRQAEALSRYQQAVDIDQSHGFAWLGLGWTHAELGHFAEAAWCLEKGIAHESSVGQRVTAGGDGYLGELLRRSGRLDEARLHCLKGVATAEASDHMYRDTFRAVCLCNLGRTALDQDDPEAARAAFTQVRLQIEGRPRALGGGHLLIQALAGLARCGDSSLYEEALVLFNDRTGFNFSWFWLCTEDVTLNELGRAALALGREDEGRELLQRAAAAAARGLQ